MRLAISLVTLDRDDVMRQLTDGPFPKSSTFPVEVIEQQYDVTPGTYILVIRNDASMELERSEFESGK